MNTLRQTWALLLIVLLWGSAKAVSQEPFTSSGNVVIDGAKHPELISDSYALRVWLLSVKESSDAKPEELQRMRLKVAATNLNPKDAQFLLGAVTQFGDQHKKLMASLPVANISTQQLKNISVQREQLLSITESRIHLGLSLQGERELQQHLLHVKQHMTIGAGPNMPHMN